MAEEARPTDCDRTTSRNLIAEHEHGKTWCLPWSSVRAVRNPCFEAINTSNFDVSTSLNKRTLCKSAYPSFVDAAFFVRLYRFTFHWRSNRKSGVFLVTLFSIYSSFVSIARKILATSRTVIAQLSYSVSCCTVALYNRFNAFNEGEFLRFLNSVLEKIENNLFHS